MVCSLGAAELFTKVPASICVCVFPLLAFLPFPLSLNHYYLDSRLLFFFKLLQVSLDSVSSFNPCIFIGRTDDEAQAPILWPSDVKN